MRLNSRLALIAAAIFIVPVTADAGVRVAFADPQHYADADSRSPTVRQDLRTFLKRLGGQLPRGTDLSITVLDISLAGFDMSTRGPDNYRLLTGATWPKIKLRYVLTKNGRAIASGEEWLADRFYRAHAGLASTSDPLRYEKNMLDDWFRSRFASYLKTGN
jgi:hypothetical protein